MENLIHLQQVKQKNMSAVLQAVWQRERISRVELVSETGLTSGTITNLVQELVERRVVREAGAISSAVGRRRIQLQLDDALHRIVGIDIGRTSFAVVVTTLTGRIESSSGGDLPQGHDPETTLNLVARRVDALMDETRAAGGRILGVGVGIPGPMDVDAGVLLQPPNFQGWGDFPLRRVLRERFSLPVWMEDDARTSALAERWYGLGKGGGDLVFVTMGVGIGSGVIIDGKLARGTHGLCGQVGHMTIVPFGEACPCGNRGCWETVGSIPGMIRRYGSDIGIGELFALAQEGDALAQTIVDETVSFLVIALTNVCNLYDPRTVVLGGRLFTHLAARLQEIANGVRAHAYASVRERIQIDASTFGDLQSAMGAAGLVLNALMVEPMRTLAP
ncbi:MAG: ROK family transcriptional regulator [Bacilli bacterium]